MISDLFINASILVTFLYLYTQLTGRKSLSTNSPLRVKIITGLYGGILSNILMFFSIQIHPVMLDLRQIPSVMLAYFGGALPAIISVVLTLIGRMVISIDVASYLSMTMSVLVVFFAWLVSHFPYPKNKKIFLIMTINNLIFTVFFTYLIEDKASIWNVFIIYWIACYVAAYLAFYVLCYIRKSQTLFYKYAHDSMTDRLTGLSNVRKFDTVFNKLIQEAKETELEVSLLYLDIDYFKQVNDTYGHQAGDKVLKEIGTILQTNARSSDTVCRNGGEEFTILLVNCPLSKAKEKADKIRRAVKRNTFRLDTGQTFQVTISIGIASYTETTSDANDLITDADNALYRAKHAGRDQVCIANEDK